MIHPKDLSHHNMIHNYIYILQLGLGNIENSKLRLIAIVIAIIATTLHWNILL